jgi:hypothetical protein
VDGSPVDVQGAPDAKAAFVQDVRVDHGGGHVGVPEQFLNGPNVVSGFEQVRGETNGAMCDKSQV